MGCAARTLVGSTCRSRSRDKRRGSESGVCHGVCSEIVSTEVCLVVSPTHAMRRVRESAPPRGSTDDRDATAPLHRVRRHVALVGGPPPVTVTAIQRFPELVSDLCRVCAKQRSRDSPASSVATGRFRSKMWDVSIEKRYSIEKAKD